MSSTPFSAFVQIESDIQLFDLLALEHLFLYHNALHFAGRNNGTLAVDDSLVVKERVNIAILLDIAYPEAYRERIAHHIGPDDRRYGIAYAVRRGNIDDAAGRGFVSV